MDFQKMSRRGVLMVDAKRAAEHGVYVSAESLNPERSLSPNEIAEILNVTGETVKNWIRNCRLPATKLANGYWKVKGADLEAFLSTRHDGVKKRIIITDTRGGTMGDVIAVVHELGYEPLVVYNYADALLKSIADYPSLFILNLAVPDAEAFKLTEKIRSTKGLKNCQILLTSESDLSDADTERALGLTVQGFLKRPIERPMLVAELERVLDRMGGGWRSKS